MSRLIAIVAVGAVALVAAAYGQSAAQQSQPGPTNAPYMPSLADIMSVTQLRHLKLSYAGTVSNWELANYDLGQIQESFSMAARLYSVFKSVPLAQLVKDESEPPLADLGKRSKERTAPISRAPSPS